MFVHKFQQSVVARCRILLIIKYIYEIIKVGLVTSSHVLLSIFLNLYTNREQPDDAQLCRCCLIFFYIMKLSTDPVVSLK